MLKHELMEFMDVEQLYAYIKYAATGNTKLVLLPDGRQEVWYEDADVHEWVLQYEKGNDIPST